jgi:transcriptional regulator with XRE-family HTH domain
MTPLQSWRARMGWSQRRAAADLGVTLPTYQSWEREIRLSDSTHYAPPRFALLAAAALERDLPPVSVSQQ